MHLAKVTVIHLKDMTYVICSYCFRAVIDQ
jgi:hypothetical protein